MEIFHTFHQSGVLPHNAGASFIALIPKTKSPERVEDFIPISLIGCTYKILAKVLSLRLRRVLHLLIISHGQTASQGVIRAYLKGRQVLDDILIEYETIREFREKKKRWMILKLDFAKAYDSVNWDAILKMLNIMNFGQK